MCSVSGGSTSDLYLHWPPTLIPSCLYSPSILPHRPAGSPFPLDSTFTSYLLEEPSSFPSPCPLLLSLNSSCPCHQQAPELSLTLACVDPLWGVGSLGVSPMWKSCQTGLILPVILAQCWVQNQCPINACRSVISEGVWHGVASYISGSLERKWG